MKNRYHMEYNKAKNQLYNIMRGSAVIEIEFLNIRLLDFYLFSFSQLFFIISISMFVRVKKKS